MKKKGRGLDDNKRSRAGYKMPWRAAFGPRAVDYRPLLVRIGTTPLTKNVAYCDSHLHAFY